MPRYFEQLPGLVLRLAIVAAAGVGLAIVMVAVGMTWHDASMWVLRIGVPVGGVVFVLWMIDLFRSR